jgi:hypothetical protein
MRCGLDHGLPRRADGKVSAEEFKKGCAAGQVKAADESTVKDMEGK